jgi:hypothetical protein
MILPVFSVISGIFFDWHIRLVLSMKESQGMIMESVSFRSQNKVIEHGKLHECFDR